MITKQLQFHAKSDRKHTFKAPNGEWRHFEDIEGCVIELLQELDIDQRMRLMKISLQEHEDYLIKKMSSHRELVVDILSRKWKCRETDELFTLKHVEMTLHNGDFKSYSSVKKMAKQGTLKLQDCETVIKEFTHDYSNWYNPE